MFTSIDKGNEWYDDGRCQDVNYAYNAEICGSTIAKGFHEIEAMASNNEVFNSH